MELDEIPQGEESNVGDFGRDDDVTRSKRPGDEVERIEWESIIYFDISENQSVNCEECTLR